MNSLVEQELPGTNDLRDQMFDLIDDADLAYALPGDNPTLGALCLEMGRIQQIYVRSFETLIMDWQLTGMAPADAGSVDALRAWFAALDDALFAALRDVAEDEVHTKRVDRGHNHTPTLYTQVQIYREALLIFYGKVSVYLKAMQKPLTPHWRSWIG